MSVGCPQSHMTSCPGLYTNHIPMYINQAAACVVPSMNHRELTLSGRGWGAAVRPPSECGLSDFVFWLPPPAENVQLRRLRPVQPFAPCGQRGLRGQCKHWRLVKLERGCEGRNSCHTKSPPLLCLGSPCPLPSPLPLHLLPVCPSFNHRIKTKRPYTEKWSNPPPRPGSQSARRSSLSRRR